MTPAAQVSVDPAEYVVATDGRSVHMEWARGFVSTFFKEEEHVPEDSEQRRGFQRASAADGHEQRAVEVDGAALVRVPDQPRRRRRRWSCDQREDAGADRWSRSGAA